MLSAPPRPWGLQVWVGCWKGTAEPRADRRTESCGMSWETHHCEVKTPPRETPVSTGRQRLELMDHQESWRGAGCLSAGSIMERGKGSPEAGSCLSRDGRIFWMVSRSETYVFEENSAQCGLPACLLVNKGQTYPKQQGWVSREARDCQAGEQGQDEVGPLSQRHCWACWPGPGLLI